MNAILDTYHIIVVVKLVGLGEFPVLCFADWHDWFGVSEAEFVGKLILKHMSENASGQLAYLGRPFLSQLNNSQHVDPLLIGSTVYTRAVFSSGYVLFNHIFTRISVDDNNDIKSI